MPALSTTIAKTRVIIARRRHGARMGGRMALAPQAKYQQTRRHERHQRIVVVRGMVRAHQHIIMKKKNGGENIAQ